MQQADAELKTWLKTCTLNVYYNPDYASIVPHLPSLENGGQPTMAQLSDDSIPTKQESRLLIKMHDDLMPCRQVFIRKFQNMSPVAAQMISEGWIESDRITIKLSKRKITWGEAAQQKQQAMLAFQKNLNNAAQAHAALAVQQQIANAASVQAGAAVMQAAMPQTIQIQAPAYHVTNTNCLAMGNRLNCTSYR